MPVPSQGHYGFHSFPVVDWFCLYIYLWVLTFPLLDCSEFGNFVITLIYTIQHTLQVRLIGSKNNNVICIQQKAQISTINVNPLIHRLNLSGQIINKNSIKCNILIIIFLPQCVQTIALLIWPKYFCISLSKLFLFQFVYHGGQFYW